ncbi:MAG: peptidase S41 [Paludibacteraceae bacterium]|nr:peptidase S41 [Paludibacteraceae bacterium]
MKIANDILIPELERLIREEKEVRFTPSGISMRPFIEGDRDSVVMSVLTGNPKKGDILLARVQNANGKVNYVLHRLIRIVNDKKGQTSYILQGDGNIEGEEICGREDIIARVMRIERPNGKRKYLSRGRLWYTLRPIRKWLLKIYRHTWLIWKYENN